MDTSLADQLNIVLASTFVLYAKTHAFHWNVVGKDFPQLHELFGNQYEEMWEAVDTIAETVRTIDGIALPNLASMLHCSLVSEVDDVPSSEEMISILCEDHTTVCTAINNAFESAEQNNDQAVMNMLADRLEAHKKHHWMLKSTSTTNEVPAELQTILKNAGILRI